MRVFVTGASGWVGTAVVSDLLAAGHHVLGLARTDEGEKKVAALGADVLRGTLDDLDVLRQGAAQSDGVIHTAFRHDFSRFAESSEQEQRAIGAMGMLVLWLDQSWHHAQAMLHHETDQLAADFFDSLLVHEPAHTAQVWLDAAYRLIFVKTGLMAWIRDADAQTHANSMKGTDLRHYLGLIAVHLEDYLLAALEPDVPRAIAGVDHGVAALHRRRVHRIRRWTGTAGHPALWSGARVGVSTPSGKGDYDAAGRISVDYLPFAT